MPVYFGTKVDILKSKVHKQEFFLISYYHPTSKLQENEFISQLLIVPVSLFVKQGLCLLNDLI